MRIVGATDEVLKANRNKTVEKIEKRKGVIKKDRKNNSKSEKAVEQGAENEPLES